MKRGESPSLTQGDVREAVGDIDFEKLLNSGWLQAVADSAPVAVMAIDTEGRMTFWNRAAEEIFGWRADEVLGRINPIVPAEKGPEFRTALEETISGRPLRGVELERRRKDGSKVWIRLSNAPLVDAAGRGWGVIAVAEDMSELVAARRRLDRIGRALRARAALAGVVIEAGSEEELFEAACRAAVEEAGYRLAWVGVVQDDPERRVIPVAQAGFEDGYLEGIRITWDESPTGRGPTGTAIRTGRPAVAADIEHDPRFSAWREDALRRGFRSSVALPIVTDAGVVGALNLYAPERGAFDEEEVKLLSGLAQDLSLAVAARRRVRESQRRLATLMANLPGMAYRCAADEQWTMEFVSEGCRQLTGYEPAQLVGNRELAYADLIHPDDRRAVWDDVQTALARRRPFVLNYRIVPAAGDVRWVWERGRGVFDDGGELLYLEGFIQDITERKQALEALQRLNEELEARVAERTSELRRAVDLMAGRELRMAELKEVIKALRRQLEEAGLAPIADDPLQESHHGGETGFPKEDSNE